MNDRATLKAIKTIADADTGLYSIQLESIATLVNTALSTAQPELPEGARRFCDGRFVRPFTEDSHDIIDANDSIVFHSFRVNDGRDLSVLLNSLDCIPMKEKSDD